mgnify:CR=1 FL=1
MADASPTDASPWKFSGINTEEDLARTLGVSVSSLYCTSILKGKKCGIPDCIYPPLLHNGKHGKVAVRDVPCTANLVLRYQIVLAAILC